MPRLRGAPLKNERGQASIFIGLMLLTFLLFFTFVVNTGMLINARINLQNAADIAAYAGASVQARQLTQIGILNYEMRRQYKKFLFRYYVLGNLAQDSHPRGGPGPKGEPRQWRPNNNSSLDFQVPVVCLIFNNNDNFCHVQKLQSISIPPDSPLDSINRTLRAQLQTLEEIRQENCKGIGKTNMQVLLYWLWNTDPTLNTLSQSLSSGSPDANGVLTKIKALASGMGLVPAEMLLKARIKTLQTYVNTKRAEAVTLSGIDKITQDNSKDIAARERTIQAFKSAYYTLGKHTFSDTDSIVMDELVPGPSNGNESDLLTLEDIKTEFDAYAFDLAITATNPNADANEADCEALPTPVPIRNLPVGVAKDPKTLTFYALRLRAKAKLLFSPFGDLELKAYAAAQPFGARIGPPPEMVSFSHEAVSPGMCGPGGKFFGVGCVGRVPNLPVAETDAVAKGQGWDTTRVIGAMSQQLTLPAAGGGGAGAKNIPVIGEDEMTRAYRAAMAPNPWEKGRYTIPNDSDNQDFFFTHFDARGTYAFWAPLKPLDSTSDPQQDIRAMITDVLSPPDSLQQKDPGFNQALKDALMNGLSDYILNKLKNQQGVSEDRVTGEGFNIVRVSDPSRLIDPSTGVPTPITLPPDIQLPNNEVRTSWTSQKDPRMLASGRVGYSVKLVSFDIIMGKTGATSNLSERWTNAPELDEEAKADIPRIKH